MFKFDAYRRQQGFRKNGNVAKNENQAVAPEPSGISENQNDPAKPLDQPRERSSSERSCSISCLRAGTKSDIRWLYPNSPRCWLPRLCRGHPAWATAHSKAAVQPDRTVNFFLGVRTELVCFLQKTVGSHFWLRSHFSGNLVGCRFFTKYFEVLNTMSWWPIIIIISPERIHFLFVSSENYVIPSHYFVFSLFYWNLIFA